MSFKPVNSLLNLLLNIIEQLTITKNLSKLVKTCRRHSRFLQSTCR